MSTIEITNKLKVSQPTLSRSSRSGEKMEKENQFEFIVKKRIKTSKNTLSPHKGIFLNTRWATRSAQ